MSEIATLPLSATIRQPDTYRSPRVRTTCSFAFLALFVRFANTRNRVLNSLRDNAYGMYLIHYAFVSWLQYALLKTGLPAIAKGSVVFLGTLALSWSVTAALRRIPGVTRIV